jgi:membrane protease YdiL (CAAX protease family)
MNKIKDLLIGLFKSLYGLFIYLGIQLLWEFLFYNNNLANNHFKYSIYLISCELAMTIGLVLLNRKRLKKDFIDFNKNHQKYLQESFKIYLVCLLLMLISNGIINYFILNNIAANEAVDRNVLTNYPMYSIFGMIIFGPFVEELTFRCAFKDHLKNKYLYYIITIILFAGAHLLAGISNLTELIYFIPYGIMAFAFADIYYKTDNIFSSTIIHTFHNTFSIIVILIGIMFGA